MQRGDQRIVDLQHRLAASQHDIAVRVAPSPGFGYHRRERRRIDIFSAERAVGADEIGIAEPACRLGTILFAPAPRSEEHTSELQSLMRISYAVSCLNKNN